MVEVKVAASVDETDLLGEPDMYGIQRFGPYTDPQKMVPVSKGGQKPEALNSMTLQARAGRAAACPAAACCLPRLGPRAPWLPYRTCSALRNCTAAA